MPAITQLSTIATPTRRYGTLGVNVQFEYFGFIERVIDPDEYSVPMEFILEIHGKTSNALAQMEAHLYNETDAAPVANSTILITSTTRTRVRSSAFSLVSGSKSYRVRFGGGVGADYTCYDAVIIAVPA